MITKNQIKLIKCLAFKKYRVKHQLFIVEGKKNVAVLLDSDYEIDMLFANDEWIDTNPNITTIKVSASELNTMSYHKHPNEVLAIVKIKKQKIQSDTGIKLVLDDINDPGNMGTIIRLCDWFGVTNIICSKNTVDIYNPKVVQSSMGSLFRISIIYTDLSKYLIGVDSSIYGAYTDGEDIKEVECPKNLHLVMGNESNGITTEISQIITKKVKIKNCGRKTESLNVAVAASILLYEICS